MLFGWMDEWMDRREEGREERMKEGKGNGGRKKKGQVGWMIRWIDG